MGFFSINKKVFSIEISLYRPIKGTKLDGKLNLLLIIYDYKIAKSLLSPLVRISVPFSIFNYILLI